MRSLPGRPPSLGLLGAGLSAALLIGGCAEVEQAAGRVADAGEVVTSVSERVGVCAEALRLAGFTPDLNNPAQAVDQAHRTAEQLSELAGQTTDETVRTALADLSASLGRLSRADLDAESGLRWVEQQAEQVEALARACG